jgi:hypothetical protein
MGNMSLNIAGAMMEVSINNNKIIPIYRSLLL